MKKAIVLGASGGMGYALVKELSERGVQTIAFARGEVKLHRLFSTMSNVQIIAGDVFQLNDLINATKGVDIIYHAVNLPYSMWEDKLLVMTEQIMKAAKENHCKLAIVDNIYAYGQNNDIKVNELSSKKPETKKGRIRLKAEQLVNLSGVPAVRAHFPDFYGPNATNTVMHTTLKNIIKHKKAMYVGDTTIQREFIYTPDGAKALIHLSLIESAYGRHWNIPSAGTISGEELILLLNEITGQSHTLQQVNKGMIRLLSLFSRNMKEILELMYLYEQPVILSGATYEREIGSLPHTPYIKGLSETLAFMKD